MCEFYGLGPEFPSDQLFTSSDTVLFSLTKP